MKIFRVTLIASGLSIALVAGLAVSAASADKEQRSPAMPSSQGSPAKPAAPAAGALPIISSSHQDIAWMDSPEKCMEFRDKSVISPALALLAKDPAYAFTMENMLNLREYLDRHPDRTEEVIRFTKEGRMEWGATFNQPYESLLSGEQLIRETYFGRRWLKRTFPGTDARVYFNPDVPGRSMQMPQILAKAGIPYMVMSRYHEGYYRWASPDGTSVLAYSPGHYGNAAAYLNAAPAEGVKAIADKVAKWKDYYTSRALPPQFPLLNSVDFSQPTDFGPLIKAWGESGQGVAGVPLTMGYSSARRFFEALDVKGARLETITGERPNLWLYIHGPTHHWAITAQRQAGVLLPAAETFSTIRSLVYGSFQNYPAERLNAAWEAAIYPDHGWGGKEGQVTDRLFRKKYEFARDTGREVLDGALAAIAARVKTQAGKGLPIVVFNALSWARTDPVVCEVPAGNGPVRIVDAAGKDVPLQVLPPLEGQAPGTARVEFLAGDVPGLGYKTYYLAAGSTSSTKAAAAVPSNVIENAFYRIELVPGGVKSVYDKELGREVLETGKFLGFEVFTMRSVGNGAGEFGRVQQPTMEGFDRLSLHGPAWKHVSAESGPLRTVFALEQPLSNCVVRQRLILRNDVKRIDCEVDILKWDGDPYREFRMALPVRAANGHVAYEVPLGVVEVGTSEIAGTGGPAYGNLVYDELCSDIRPREVGNFIGAWDAAAGVTLTSSVAVCDFKDPTPSPVPYPVLQPILLASRRSCHGEGNWYLQEGDHSYRFSMTSHAPDWRNGYKPGTSPNNSLIAVVGPAAAAGAALPESMSFLKVSAPNVLVSTFKKAEDDESAVLRVYDIEGQDGETTVGLFVPIKSAEKTNIIEDEGTPLKPRKDGLAVKVGHHAIETLKLRTAEKN